MFCFYLLLLLSLTRVQSKSCPTAYYHLKSDDMCVTHSSQSIFLGSYENFCQGKNNGVPISKRISDEGLKELASELKIYAEATMPPKAYIGLKKDDQMGSKKWIFSNDQGSVEEDDYSLWTRKPYMNEQCATVMPSEDYKVQPVACNENARPLCEKSGPPCYHGNVHYVFYHSKCLSPVEANEQYESAKIRCFEGFLFPYKDSNDKDSVAAALLNFGFEGGIFANVKKTNGKWMYANGEEETERWDKDDLKEQECGVLGFKKDFSLGMYTMNCNSQLHVLCEYIGLNGDCE
ncbi:uncharacterized protein LOC118199492 isoform X2 [Stegodyphus dumicola]|uniref:uncharacterized protein LOC118199492 isoform X2 n=1 Tax=Stegodyphus dumicola TaxID=202533 RepID=UPI0015B250EB|nr:uncharacterized protein LOC118199492 isoform X2 [Stegodyphus dumicola]XP_035227262.1 uncharacterized protein LOC118199492 isoform X2 [Stegodyphus dumicola]